MSVSSLAAWLLIKAFRRPKVVDPLAQEAEAAVQAISAGKNLGNVIIDCYLQMENAIASSYGISRAGAITPREFESYLVKKGIPKNAVLQLTRLFEKARYGNQGLDQQDEQAAVRCLTEIRTACQ
jgi:hypothetical protein